MLSLWKNIKCKGYKIKQHIGNVTVKVNTEKGIKCRFFICFFKKYKCRMLPAAKSFGLLCGFFGLLFIISFSYYLLSGISVEKCDSSLNINKAGCSLLKWILFLCNHS